MQVANDEILTAESYVLVERGKEKKLVGLESLFKSFLVGWRIVSDRLHVSNNILGENLREPTELECTRIDAIKNEHAQRIYLI